MTYQEGQALSPLAKPAITAEQLREYAEASGDTNPIHLDPDFARDAGFPSVIAHGMLSMGFLGDYVRHHFPESRYDLVRFKARFRKVTFPGDTLTCEGRVKAVLPDGSLALSVLTRNQGGEVTTDGEAVVRPR